MIRSCRILITKTIINTVNCLSDSPWFMIGYSSGWIPASNTQCLSPSTYFILRSIKSRSGCCSSWCKSSTCQVWPITICVISFQLACNSTTICMVYSCKEWGIISTKLIESSSVLVTKGNILSDWCCRRCHHCHWAIGLLFYFEIIYMVL